jgi:cell division protein FtsW
MRLQRTDESRLTRWWFTVDRQLLALILILIGIGLVLSLVASPSIAIKRGLGSYYFVKRHMAFAGLGTILILLFSFASPVGIRRTALALTAVCLPALVLVLCLGPEINGAQRWLVFNGWQIQPSEFAKPAVVVLFAWALADQRRHPDMPALPIVSGLVISVMILMTLQPDMGQTVLVGLVCLTLYFLSGRPLRSLAVLLAAAALALVMAYITMDHVRSRVDRYFDRTAGDTYQMDKARASFVQGGWLGRGPGEGTIKTALPDAHTDYILAVIAEEYGVVAGLGLLALFALILMRVIRHFWLQPEPEERLMMMGLALLVGLNALINIGVNAGLLPAKGMTLPFISYGGSSLLGSSIAMGMLLALTRRQPGTPQSRPIVLVHAK